MPELVSTLCTFLVLAPLALMPGLGRFLFMPMTLAVMFAMSTAYLLSRTLVPCASAFLLHQHEHDVQDTPGAIGRAFAAWSRLIDRGIGVYVRALDAVLRHPVMTVAIAFGLLAVTLVALLPVLRREFFPEVDSRAFEMAVRAPSGTRIEETEKLIAQVEQFIRDTIPENDLKTIISEIGLTADWAAAYTPNAGPMDAVVKVQLEEHHRGSQSSQDYIRALRAGFAGDQQRFGMLEFSFDAGGLVRGALNEGKSTPINVQLIGQDQKVLAEIAGNIKQAVQEVDGIVDARVLEKLDYPEWTINVDRAKAAAQGLNQDDIMKNVIAATNSSITFNKRNFWIDLQRTGNQYYVGVQYPEKVFHSEADVKNIPITSPMQGVPIPLENVATLSYTTIPTESHHVNLQPTIDLTMNVEGRDLGHVSVDVARLLEKFGVRHRDQNNAWDGTWVPDDPYFASPAAQFRVDERDDGPVAMWTTQDGATRAVEVITEKGRRLALDRQPRRGPRARNRAGSRGRGPRCPAGLADQSVRRVHAHAGHVSRPGSGAAPGVAAHLLPDGGAGSLVHRAAGRHAHCAAVPDRHPAGAVPYRQRHQRAVAVGLHLHRRHQGREYGADDRLRPGAAAP